MEFEAGDGYNHQHHSSTSSVPSSSHTINLEQNQEERHQRQQPVQIIHKSKRRRFQRAIETALSTIMNAAVTIFGVGVGVGLILGDSMRGRDRVGSITVTTTATRSSTSDDDNEERGDRGRTVGEHHSRNLLPPQ